MIERAGPASSGPPIASRASRLAAGPAPQLTPIASAPAAARAWAAARGGVPSARTSSSPKVSEAMTGRSEARRASSRARSSWPRSEKVSSTTRSIPPSSSPSICSRKAALAAGSGMTLPPRAAWLSGPTEPPTSASRPLTSRASRASAAARRLRWTTRFDRPHVASRGRFAPNERVSISSAPASRYSRCAPRTSSAWVATSSSRQARWGTPRLNSRVPIPPSTSSGRRARRSRKRWRGEVVDGNEHSLEQKTLPDGKGLEGSSPYRAGGPARTWHLAGSTPAGCRGFNGPVPPPLLIRALQLSAHDASDGRDEQSSADGPPGRLTGSRRHG